MSTLTRKRTDALICPYKFFIPDLINSYKDCRKNNIKKKKENEKYDTPVFYIGKL